MDIGSITLARSPAHLPDRLRPKEAQEGPGAAPEGADAGPGVAHEGLALVATVAMAAPTEPASRILDVQGARAAE